MKTLLGTALATTLLALPLAVAPADAVPESRCDGQRVTQRGTDGDDQLRGTPGDDVVTLGDGDDAFEGLGGDDVVCGDAGNDVLLGGRGDDTLLGGDGDDALVGKKGEDVLLAGPGLDVARGGGGGDVLGGVSGSLFGGPGNDVFDADLAYARPRDLRVLLGRGDDLGKLNEEESADVSGGPGADRFTVVGPSEMVDAWGFEYTVDGDAGRDVLTFRDMYRKVRVDVDAGRATMGHWWVEFSAVEVVEGSDQDDVIRGWSGPDVLRGLGGDDVIRGRGGRDSADGGAGADTCTAEARVRCERR